MTKGKKIVIGVCAGLAVVAVIVTFIVVSHFKKKGEDPVLPDPTPVVSIMINDDISDIMKNIFILEGAGNEAFYNETTRDKNVPFVIYVSEDKETGVSKTYGTFFVSYNSQEKVGEGEEQETIDLLHPAALTFELSQETIELINKPGTQEEIAIAVQKDFEAAAQNNKVGYNDNYHGLKMDDEQYASFIAGIRSSLLAQPESFVGYTEAAEISVISCYKDDSKNTCNVFGMISEGANSQYFMFNRSYATMKEFVEARNALKNMTKGQKVEDAGFTLTSQADLDNQILVFEIDGKTYTFKSGMVVAEPVIDAEVKPEQ